MTEAERNYLLLAEIDANRLFILTTLRQNPRLLACAEERIRRILSESTASRDAHFPPSTSGGLLAMEITSRGENPNE